jgi:hypothetical protein
MPASLQLGAGYRAEVPKLWGSYLSFAGDLFVWETFILNEILAQDKIYISVGTLLS